MSDRLLSGLDNALRTVLATPTARRETPSSSDNPADHPPPSLTEAERQSSASLMRVNHAGEVAAQALYQGQALVARTEHLRRFLLDAAADEADHLAWTHERLSQLGSGPSRLSALWYSGAFALGAAAGLVGDRVSLGFLSETERQVEAHLAGHLNRLPANDTASRAICAQMMADEASHGREARAEGAAELPEPIRQAMRLASQVMIATAARV